MTRKQQAVPLGRRFGSMRVIGHELVTRANGKRVTMWRMLCDCGTQRLLRPDNREGVGAHCRCKAAYALVVRASTALAAQAEDDRAQAMDAEREILGLKRKRRDLAPANIPAIAARVPRSVFELGGRL